MRAQNENGFTVDHDEGRTGDFTPPADQSEILESLFEKIDAYIQTSVKLVKLKAIDRMVQVTGSWVAHLLLFVFFCFFLVMVSVGMAIWAGNQLGALHYGFLIVSGVYLLVFLLILFFGKPILKKIFSRRLLSDLI